MLSLFRTNQILACVLYLPYLILLRLPVYLFPDRQRQVFQNESLFPELFDSLLQYPLLAECIQIAFLLAIAVFITLTATLQRVDREISLFPGLLFLLISSLLPDLLPFSPLLPAVLLIWFATDQLIHTYRQYEPVYQLYNTGFAIGAAILFYPSFSIFLLMVFLGVNSLRSFNPKEYLLILIGFITPLFLVGVAFFWYDRFQDLWGFLQAGHSFLDWKERDDFRMVELLPYGIFLFIVLLSRPSYRSKKSMPSRKSIDVIYLILSGTGLVALFTHQLDLDLLVMLSAPLGLLLTMNLTRFSIPASELIHFLLLLLYAYYQYGWMILPFG